MIGERLHSLVARTRELLSGRRVQRELDEEFRFHIDAEVAHNIRRGLSPDDAHRAAMTAFGGVERYRDETRGTRGSARIDSLLRDTRLAFRRLRRAPAYSSGVIATLAVGLGVVTSIGALVYGVMLRPLPYVNPDRLVRISIHTPGLGITTPEHSSGTFVYFQERARSFTQLGASMENKGVAITDGESPELVASAIVTPNIFPILGTVPAAGHLFRDEDAVVEGDVPVLISYDLWQRRFGGAPDIAGKFIELNRRPREILGVLPEGFDYPSRVPSIYYPERVQATRAGLADRYLTVVGRLAPGVSVSQAQAELDVLSAQLHVRFPELSSNALGSAGFSARVELLRDAIVSPVRAELTLLTVMVAALLLIAMANAATLTLLRAQRMLTEVAVARALGANRGTVAQRFIVEGIVVALAGGLLAYPIAAAATVTKFGLTDAQIPRLHEVSITPLLGLALVAVSLLIGTVLGLVAAARAGAHSTQGTAQALRSDTRTTRGRGWRRTQEGLVTTQIALALSLLMAAGLMASSLAKLQRVDIGFAPANAAKFTANLPFRAYSTFQKTAAFHLAVMDALRAVPGVTSVGGGMQFPSTPQLLSTHPRVETTNANGVTSQVLVNANVVSADFFTVMGIPLLDGRSFQPGDLASPEPNVVLGTSLARELFGSASPVGSTVRIGSNSRYPAYRVVGVVGDVYSERTTDGPLRTLYFPMLGDLPPTSTETENRIPFMPAGMHYVVRSALPLSALAPEFRRAVQSVDPRVPVWDIRTLDDIVADATARTRLTMLLLGLAAITTLFLGAIGLYSVIAYAVAGRSREFAVRLAVGASPRKIRQLVLVEGTRVAVIGILAGWVLSLASTRVLRDLVYEINPTSPAIYAAATAIVLLCTAAATLFPARRAGNISPVRALHGE